MCFFVTGLNLPIVQAEDFHLPVPGVMVHLSPPLDPPILKGIKVHPDNPFQFDFILDKGDGVSVIARSEATKQSQQEQLKTESTKLIKYFLASLTIPEKDLWVNLSPYEKDRIIPQSFGLTEMGRDLLAEDYMLKQITASLIYPEDQIGKKFWKRIYQEAFIKYGTTNIPVNTFNKVWIVPQKAVVYENAKAGTAYVMESKLKVMLEQDYLALEKNNSLPLEGRVREGGKDVNALGSQIVREIVIPELTKEVNENKNFAHLRQVYNSLILATWYKKKIKNSILEQVYADKNKIAGVKYESSVIARSPSDEAISKGTTNDVEKIYQRYLKAFKKGAYNFIKEDMEPGAQETIPRKYFSGGVDFVPSELDKNIKPAIEFTDDNSMLSKILKAASGLTRVFILGVSLQVAQAQTPQQHPAKPASIPVIHITKGILDTNTQAHIATTQQALQITLDHFKQMGGRISMNDAIHGMGFTDINEYADAMWTGYIQSTNFKKSLSFLSASELIDANGIVESGDEIKKSLKRADGNGSDFGIYGTQQSLLKYSTNYYIAHPSQYVIEAIGLIDQFYGESKIRADKIWNSSNPLIFKYFGISREEWDAICLRIVWNRGPKTPDQVFKRAIITINEPELWLSDLPKAAAKFDDLVFGKHLDCTTKLNMTRIDEEKKDIDSLLDWSNSFDPRKQPGVDYNKVMHDKIEAIRAKYRLVSSSNILPLPNLTNYNSYTFNVIDEELSYPATQTTNDAAQLAQDLVPLSSTKNRIFPVHSLKNTSSTGGIDLTPANLNLQTQNSNGQIKFHIDPAMLAQLQNAPGFVPVIINIQPVTDLKIFLVTAT